MTYPDEYDLDAQDAAIDEDGPPNFTWWAVVFGLGLMFWIAVAAGGRAAGWW